MVKRSFKREPLIAILLSNNGRGWRMRLKMEGRIFSLNLNKLGDYRL
jgi:hypothetical protein